MRKSLLGTGKFVDLALKQDEDEHSIEMQFPYIAKIMEKYVEVDIFSFSRACLLICSALEVVLVWVDKMVTVVLLNFSYANNFTIIPILVGSLSFSEEQGVGEVLAPYLADPSNVFVISSDFCHWGKSIGLPLVCLYILYFFP